MTFKDIFDAAIGVDGAVFLLLIFAFLAMTGKIVFGWLYERERLEKEHWRDIAWSLVKAGRKAVDLLDGGKE